MIRGVWLSSSARRRAHNDVIGHQVDDGALPDQTEDTHGTTTDTDDTIGSLQRKGGAFRTGSYRVEKGLAHLEQGNVDGELGDTSDDDRVRSEEVCDLMSQNNENSTESSTTFSRNRNFLSDNRQIHTC